MRVLETERLFLRHFVPADIDEFAPLEADPVVMRYYSSGTRSREAATRGIAWFMGLQEEHGFSHWAAIRKSDERFVGYCGLLPQTIDGIAEVEVSYKMVRDVWGQGLATEAATATRDWAFAHLDVPYLISIIHPENVASIRVAEKNGMALWKESEFLGVTCRIYRVKRPGVTAG